MPEFSDDDPARWRALATEARAKAETLNDPTARRIMLEVADNYRKLAEYAERCRARNARWSKSVLVRQK
jgi:hypothetical protein